MKIKTGELSGAQLDWAVAKCEPDDTLAVYFDEETGAPLCHDDWQDNQEFKPSSNWAQGGPIIELEGISLECRNGDWIASYAGFPSLPYFSYEPLVSAMRCYVASKLGDEVEIPAELMEAE